MKGIFKFIKRTIGIILFVLIIIVSYITYDGYTMYKSSVKNISIQDKVNQIKQDEYYTNINNIPETFSNAILAIEDHRFYYHGSIDLIATSRAIITNLQDKSFTEGGSTITQQLAKNMYFTQEKKLTRKVAELFVAMDLEKTLSKDEILELYMNVIYYGDGYIGVGEASHGYFNKLPSNLTLYEQTLLAGLPNAPSIYELSNNSVKSYQRQNQVVDAMCKYDYLSIDEADKIKETNKYIFKKYE